MKGGFVVLFLTKVRLRFFKHGELFLTSKTLAQEGPEQHSKKKNNEHPISDEPCRLESPDH